MRRDMFYGRAHDRAGRRGHPAQPVTAARRRHPNLRSAPPAPALSRRLSVRHQWTDDPSIAARPPLVRRAGGRSATVHADDATMPAIARRRRRRDADADPVEGDGRRSAGDAAGGSRGRPEPRAGAARVTRVRPAPQPAPGPTRSGPGLSRRRDDAFAAAGAVTMIASAEPADDPARRPRPSTTGRCHRPPEAPPPAAAAAPHPVCASGERPTAPVALPGPETIGGPGRATRCRHPAGRRRRRRRRRTPARPAGPLPECRLRAGLRRPAGLASVTPGPLRVRPRRPRPRRPAGPQVVLRPGTSPREGGRRRRRRGGRGRGERSEAGSRGGRAARPLVAAAEGHAPPPGGGDASPASPWPSPTPRPWSGGGDASARAVRSGAT